LERGRARALQKPPSRGRARNARRGPRPYRSKVAGRPARGDCPRVGWGNPTRPEIDPGTSGYIRAKKNKKTEFALVDARPRLSHLVNPR